MDIFQNFFWMKTFILPISKNITHLLLFITEFLPGFTFTKSKPAYLEVDGPLPRGSPHPKTDRKGSKVIKT